MARAGGPRRRPAGSVNLVQMPVDHVVPHAVAPVDHLPWEDPQSEPVPGPGGDLLAQDHQQIVVDVPTPGAMCAGGVVLGGREEINSRRTGTGRKLLRRQLAAVRDHRMHMAVTSVPPTPPIGHLRRREGLRYRKMPSRVVTHGHCGIVVLSAGTLATPDAALACPCVLLM